MIDTIRELRAATGFLVLAILGVACGHESEKVSPDAADQEITPSVDAEEPSFELVPQSWGVAHTAGDVDCVYEPKRPEPLGPHQTTVRLLTANIYGQHVEGASDVLGFRSDLYCEDRLEAIGEQILAASPPYDVVGLQEWHSDSLTTCDGAVLKNLLKSNGYPTKPTGYAAVEQGKNWRHFRWAHPHAYDQRDGGLGLISRTPFVWEDYSEDDFDDVFVDTENVIQFHPRLKPRGAHGVTFARIYLDYPDQAIDTYNVHVPSTQQSGPAEDMCDDDCKVYMLGQLREMIHERSATSGNPVVVMGDFNIGGPNPTFEECVGNSGYAQILQTLGNPVDVWQQAHPGEAGSTHNWDHATRDPSRIDFIFLVDDPYLANSDFELRIERSEDVAVVDWQGLSDHHGVEATLSLRRKLSWASVSAAIL